MPQRDYICPIYGSSQDRLAGYLREAVQEGEAWLGAQRPAADYDALLERFSGMLVGAGLDGQSNAEYPKVERLAREIVAALGTFQNVGEISPTARKDLYQQAGVLTKLDQHWFEQEEVFAATRSLLQYGVTLGTAYAWQYWDKHYHGLWKGDVRIEALGPTDVTFVQLPKDHDLQRAYIVLIKQELPINLARRIYAPTNRAFAEALRPDRDSPGWVQKGLRKVQQFLSPALRVRGTRPSDPSESAFPTCDIFHAYILDGSVNDSGQPRQMGAHGTNWSYMVPSVGDPIPTGLLNPATQQQWTRPATETDALLFPLRRYCIFARSTEVIGYDGSSPWWHGMVPVAKFRFNDWPWQALGKSCVGMVGPMEDTMNAIMRGAEDSIAARLDPPGIYNDNIVSQTWAEAFNTRKAGTRAGAPLDQGEIIKFPVPAGNYDVPNWIFDYVKYVDERSDYLSGARDLTAIAQARQLPSGDTLEKLLEMAGPLVQDMVRSVILPLKQLGTMRIGYYLQFYTAERIVTSTNANDEPEDWLYNQDQIVGRVEQEPLESRIARARMLLAEFRYRVTKSGVSDINRMTTKLFFMQLMKDPKFPMDPWTFARVAELPRFGEEPTGTNSMLERWLAWQRMLAEFQKEFADSANGNGQPRGRPSSDTAPPRMVQKDGGTRTTVATSR
jgi:hypothetical protein